MIEINKYDKIIVANWKLNGSFAFIKDYFKILNSATINSNVCGIICPPSSYLQNCYLNMDKSLFLGSQDCSNYKNGAYTGDISSSMLKDNDCKFCIVGHSERRQLFSQKNVDIMEKSNNLIQEDINPIICIGETLDEKKNGNTEEILKEQIMNSMPDNSSNNDIIIAYEPIWAIGTGLTPSTDEINKIHHFLKTGIEKYQNFKILYGGSVKSNNSSEIMNLDHVDGVLVGGSSLDPLEFSKILNA